MPSQMHHEVSKKACIMHAFLLTSNFEVLLEVLLRSLPSVLVVRSEDFEGVGIHVHLIGITNTFKTSEAHRSFPFCYALLGLRIRDARPSACTWGHGKNTIQRTVLKRDAYFKVDERSMHYNI